MQLLIILVCKKYKVKIYQTSSQSFVKKCFPQKIKNSEISVHEATLFLLTLSGKYVNLAFADGFLCLSNSMGAYVRHMARSISDEVKQQVESIIRQFNARLDYGYVTRYRGCYLYLDRKSYFGRPIPICRLKYTGDMNSWEFAIYQYSTERYVTEEWLFPGGDHADGTIEGALKAGLEVYPT